MIECTACGRRFQTDVTPLNCSCGVKSFPVAITQRIAAPPNWTRLVRLLRKPSDKGVGDTVERIATKFGGKRFKLWAKRIGIPCGCARRKNEWNARYSYED